MTTALLDRPPVVPTDDTTRREFLLATAALAIGLAACGNEDASTPVEQTRTVNDAYGAVRVPVDPQRVVAMDRGAADIAVAVGIRPIGVADELVGFPYLAKGLEDVARIGPPDSPNFERILELEPDLILGLDAYLEEGKAYARLQEIAPTFAARFGAGDTWREFSMDLATGLGREAELTKQFADYDAKVAKLRTDLGDRLDTTATIIRVDPAGGTNHMIYLAGMFCGNVVYNDVGLAIPEQLRERAGDPKTAWTDLERESIIEISPEQFRLAEADAIFIWNHGDHTGDALVQAVLDDPLFGQLDAVRDGHVYPVGTHWIQETLTGASMMVDDLRATLVTT